MGARPEAGSALDADLARGARPLAHGGAPARARRAQRAQRPAQRAPRTSPPTTTSASRATPPSSRARRRALEEWGAGGRASRLLGGGSPEDAEVERAAAAWLGAEAALLFPSGYHANLGLLGALAGPGDRILSDELNHASLVDGARLSRARARVYGHGDLEHLARLLAVPSPARRTLVVTESVFSMDGDRAPLARARRALRAPRGRLVVDEAHAAGVVGPDGAGGWAEAAGRGSSARGAGPWPAS